MQTTYKRFPLANLLREWDKLITYTPEQIQQLQDDWKQIHEENKEKSIEIAKIRNEKLNEVIKALKNAGIQIDKKSKTHVTTGHLAWFDKNIVHPLREKYPSYSASIPSASMMSSSQEVKGVMVKLHRTPSSIIELHRMVTNEYERVIKQQEQKNLLLVRSIEYATKHNINIEGLTTKAIIETVRSVAVDHYLAKELPMGTEINISCCSECSTYEMGEYRCGCGNTRISIVVEGDLVSGFYHYDERC